jgi:hypothetical protein
MKAKKTVMLIFVFLFCLFDAAFGGCPCDKKIVLKSVDFPGSHKEDGFWAAIHAAADGKVYIGLNTEGGGHNHFYIYDPAKDKMIHRADMAKVLGGYGKAIKTHAKIHTKICEDNDGNIYFATGNMGAGPDEVDTMSWEGGHWVKYSPKEDKFYDLGLVAPYRGLYGLAIDKKRKLLIGVCREGHLMVHNIDTGETIDKGRVCLFPGSVARTIVADDEGNVYITFHPDRIAKYDAKSGRLVDLSLRMPSDPTVYPVTGSIFNHYMRSGLWDDINKRMYGAEGSTSILFEFDPKAGEEGQIRELDRLLPCQASEKIRRAHYASLSLALGLDRKIYYIPIGSMTPEDHEKTNSGKDFFSWLGQAYLISYDLKTGKKECLGRVYAENGAKAIDFLNGAPSGGATTGADGTIYFCAFVEDKGPAATGMYTTNVSARLKLLIYKPN